MKVADLSSTARDKVNGMRYDRIIEKHEGPWNWQGFFKYSQPEFLRIGAYDVLLPLDKEHHPNITVLRCIPAADSESITLFLKDTTHCDNPRYEKLEAGFVAVCDKVADESFFVAIVYHEWYITF